MIGAKDTLTLAVTKLRIRRVRLAITVIISGLLFSLLVFLSLATHGLAHSLKVFMGDGFLSRYVVQVQGYPLSYEQDPRVIARVQALEKAQIEAKKAEAKRLGIPYDAAAEVSAVRIDQNPDGKKTTVVTLDSPFTAQAVAELNSSQDFVKKLEAAAKTFGAGSVSQSVRAGYSTTQKYSMAPIIAGKEAELAQSMGGPDPLGGFSQMLTVSDEALLKPFILPGTSLATGPDGSIATILPIDAVEKLTGRTKPSNKATPDEQLAYIASLREAARDAKFQVCYRNEAAIEINETAKQQAKTKLEQAGQPGYEPPLVEYKLATTPCTPTAIARDSRTAAQKATAAKREAFDMKFGKEIPLTVMLNFRIVGILPRTFSPAEAQDPLGLVSGFLTSSLGDGIFISTPASAAHPILDKVNKRNATTDVWSSAYYVEFPNREQQKAFTTNHNCDYGTADQSTPSDPFSKCRAEGKFFIQPFGNPLATLADIEKDTKKALYIVIGILAALAGLIMMGTIGKIIADSRKETSVFRAVGAKRRDIAQIYLLFSVILALGGLLAAIILGTAAGIWYDQAYSPLFTLRALLAFNSNDLERTFHLIYFQIWDFLKLAGFVVLVGLAGALLPLASNLRRSPIKDMRED